MHPHDTAALVGTLLALVGQTRVLTGATDGSYRMHEALGEALQRAAEAIVDLDRRVTAMEERCRSRKCPAALDRASEGYFWSE